MTASCWRPLPLAVLLVLTAGCTPERAHTPPPADASARWHDLGDWSGRGNRQTESFEVTTGALRLAWETRNESPAAQGTLRVSLHSAISGRRLQTIVDAHGVGGSTVNIEDDPRTSYLEIESANIEWRVRLEEAVVTARREQP